MPRPIKYNLKDLAVGDRVPIAAKKWNRFQYAWLYTERLAPKKFVSEWENEQSYLKRIA